MTGDTKVIAASGAAMVVAGVQMQELLILIFGSVLWLLVFLLLAVGWGRRCSARARVAELDRAWQREMIQCLRNYPHDQAWLYGHFRLAGVPAPPGIKPLPPKGPSGISRSPSDVLRHHGPNGCAVSFRQCRDPDHWKDGDMPDVLPAPPNPGRVTGGLPRRRPLPLPATSAYLEEVRLGTPTPTKRDLR